MSGEISESDWKLFRKLRVIALDRFCERALAEMTQLANQTAKTHHDRYLAVFELMRRRDRELAAAFDGARRSMAWNHLALIRSYGLLSEEELSQFGPETREVLKRYADLRSKLGSTT